jgi:hypothetical protein
MKATKRERTEALEIGWGPFEKQKGFLTKIAEDVVQKGECVTYNVYGRCPYGDTASAKGCRFLHVDKNGKVVTRGVSTVVPAALKCNRCSAVGKYWSHLCTTNGQGPGGGQPRSGGRGARRGGRGGGGGGRGARQGARLCLTDHGHDDGGDHEQARRVTIDVAMPRSFFDIGFSCTISDRIEDFLRMYHSKRAIVIDVAGGGTMETHFYGTTCTYVKETETRGCSWCKTTCCSCLRQGRDSCLSGRSRRCATSALCTSAC